MRFREGDPVRAARDLRFRDMTVRQGKRGTVQDVFETEQSYSVLFDGIDQSRIVDDVDVVAA